MKVCNPINPHFPVLSTAKSWVPLVLEDKVKTGQLTESQNDRLVAFMTACLLRETHVENLLMRQKLCAMDFPTLVMIDRSDDFVRSRFGNFE